MRTIITLVAAFILIHAASSAAVDKKVAVAAFKATVGTDTEALKKQMVSTKAKWDWYKNESPERKVEMNSFRIDAMEVTNSAFSSIFPNFTYPLNLAEHPAVNVTWQMANDYCRKVNGRLPSEEEWETAARGTRGTVYPWGDEFSKDNAVYSGSGLDNSLKVGSYELEESISSKLGGTRKTGSIESGKSEFGLYDMAGNVWEWVDGWYDAEKGLRLLKGGSWLSPAESLRSATRLGDEPESKFNDYGFRCAYNID
ncbi:MAG: formylglycine-generating enzyme family protein [Nitrospinota bacterium]|nr:formylglycine-generating enzyme family protein [Nitrospinota bacterium]